MRRTIFPRPAAKLLHELGGFFHDLIRLAFPAEPARRYA